jgi:hypothetical protein
MQMRSIFMVEYVLKCKALLILIEFRRGVRTECPNNGV